MFYTDRGDAFIEVPLERHVMGKSGTFTIEQNNSNTRHHLGRFTRRTKSVSKSQEMVDLTIRLWCSLTKPEVFAAWQEKFLYIYK
jgi:IS1 family transposase